jgi:hypothetical protein
MAASSEHHVGGPTSEKTMFNQERPGIGPSWRDREALGFASLSIGTIIIPNFFDEALNWWRLAAGGVLLGLGGYLLATAGRSRTAIAEERSMARPADLVLIVLATLASGAFCYALAAWYGLVPGGGTVDATDLFLTGVIALTVVGSTLKKRRPRISLALFIAVVAWVVLMMMIVGRG